MKRRQQGEAAPYSPPLSGTPDERLSTFVAHGRTSRRYGRDCAFDAARWDVTDEVAHRSGVPARPGAMCLQFGATDIGTDELWTFVRAFVGQLPRAGYSRLRTYVQAGRLLSEAMGDHGVYSVTEINVATLNAASALAQDRNSPGSAARLGGAIRSLGEFLHAHGMTRAPLVGALRTQAPLQDRDRAGEAFAVRSQRSLPTDRFLEALADAYRLATEPADVIVTRVALLLLSAPGRINEVLALEEAVEVERNASGLSVLGLRWPGSKGSNEGVKWIAPAMAQAVRGACADLLHVTAEGRLMKTRYGSNPNSLVLPPVLEPLRGKAVLSSEESSVLLGRRPGPKLAGLSFQDVEARLLAQLHGRMRDAGGLRTRPLLVVPWGTFDTARRPSCPCMFETVKYRHIADALGGRSGRGGRLFRRLKLDAEGEVRGRTHMLRHWVITAALRDGLALEQLAEWSGHASAREVSTYDHRTAAELRAIVRRVSVASRHTASPLAQIADPPLPTALGVAGGGHEGDA